jgi:hypothetical protein
LLVLVAGLVLAALGSSGSPWATGPDPARISAGWLNVAFTVAVLAVLVLLVYVAYSVWPERIGRRRRDRPTFENVRLLLWTDRLVLLLLLAAAAGSIVAVALVAGRRVPPETMRPPPALPPGSLTEPRNRPGIGPTIEWPLLAAGAAALALGGAIAYVRSRRRRGVLAPPAAPPGLLAALDESLDDLARDPDARRVVIRAYVRMERSLARSGIPRRPAEAPFEYVERVLRDLRGGDREIRELTDLFALARFSQHGIGSSMKERAISALSAVRSRLGETA